MRAKGINSTELAARIGTTRQSLENTWRQGVQTPKYLRALAKEMGTTTDELLAGKYQASPPDDSTPKAAKAVSESAMDIEEAIYALAHLVGALRGPQRAAVQAALREMVENPAAALDVAEVVGSVVRVPRMRERPLT